MPPGRELPVIQPGQPGAPPVFGKIGIVGLGLIGGSVALATREAWPGSLVIGVDGRAVLEQAMQMHAIDVAADDPVVLAEADLVLLAAPVEKNVELLEVVAAHVPGKAIVSDVGSTKRAIVAAARALPARLAFVGGHPLAGASRSGIRHARADLFRQRPWLLTPEGDGQGEAVLGLKAFVEGLGAVPHIMRVAAHDHLLAALSHLPQLTATALMRVIGERIGSAGLALAGRGLRDTTRMASSPATPWLDVCATNRDEIAAAIDHLINELGAVRDQLAGGQKLSDHFESANEWRAVLEQFVPRAPTRDE